uniref:Uncharacterized protein n=1 Tax=Mola mola TaxID=94237 RepID=A0A3Q3VUM3_MOLML
DDLLQLLSSIKGLISPQAAKHPFNIVVYKRLFETKRKDQLNALKNLVELNDINQQYKIIDIMLKGLFKMLHTAEAFQKILREEEKRRRKEEKRKEIRKGPRISRSRTEL